MESTPVLSVPSAGTQHPTLDQSVPPRQAEQASDKVSLTQRYLTDSERECAIGLAASMVEHHMAEWEATGCFADRGAADRARLRMEALIKGRSPEQVAKLEAERGLA